MLNILILDQAGETYGIAAQLARQGHIVKLWSEAPETLQHEPVFGPRSISDYHQHTEAADYVLCNNPRTGGIADDVRKGSRMAVGGRVQGSLVEPAWQMQIADMLGLQPKQEASNQAYWGLWDGKKWKAQFSVVYYQRMLDQERGPQTTGMGCLAKPVIASPLGKLDEFLEGLHTPGIYGLALTQDGSFHSFQPLCRTLELAAISEIVKGGLNKVLMALVQRHTELSYLRDMLGASLALAYLNPADARLQDTQAAWKHFWPEAQGNILGFTSARGYTLKELRSRIYHTIESLVLTGTIYRTDLGLHKEKLYGIPKPNTSADAAYVEAV